MKKIFTTALLSALMIFSLPGYSKERPGKMVSSAPMTAEEASRLRNRLEEIRNMDRSKMSRAEKKALRKEVKAAEEQIASTGGGIYISLGALLIIILLIILL